MVSASGVRVPVRGYLWSRVRRWRARVVSRWPDSEKLLDLSCGCHIEVISLVETVQQFERRPPFGWLAQRRTQPSDDGELLIESERGGMHANRELGEI